MTFKPDAIIWDKMSKYSEMESICKWPHSVSPTTCKRQKNISESNSIFLLPIIAYGKASVSAEFSMNWICWIVGLLEPFDFVSLSQEAFEETSHALDARLWQFESLSFVLVIVGTLFVCHGQSPDGYGDVDIVADPCVVRTRSPRKETRVWVLNRAIDSHINVINIRFGL